MTRALARGLLLLLLVGCGCGGGEHTLTVTREDSGALRVVLSAPTGHAFAADVSAKVNGRALPPPVTSVGSKGKFFSEASSPALATFRLPAADNGPTEPAAVVVEVRDGDDTFTLESPTFNVARSFSIANAADEQLVGGSIVRTTDDPVASDAVRGSIAIDARGQSSCVGGDSVPCDHCAAFKLAADLSWWCGDRPAAGTTLAAEARADVAVLPEVTKCEGPDLTCQATHPLSRATGAVTLKF